MWPLTFFWKTLTLPRKLTKCPRGPSWLCQYSSLWQWSVGLAGCAGVAACLGVHRVWSRLSDRGPWADGWPRRGIGLLSLRWETSGPVGGEFSVPGAWSVGRGLTGVRQDLRWPPRCLRVSPCVVISFRPSWGLCVPCVTVDFFCAGMACRRQRRCPPSWYRAILNILTESCLVPGWGSAGVRVCHFCAAGRLGHMVREGPGEVWHHSICVCMCMGLRGWGPDCLAVDNRDAGGYADPSLISIVRFSW